MDGDGDDGGEGECGGGMAGMERTIRAFHGSSVSVLTEMRMMTLICDVNVCWRDVSVGAHTYV